MAKEKRATWWKMFYHQRAAIESVSNEDAGKGLKAAFQYFDGEDVNQQELTQAAFTVFCVMRPYIDESKNDYERRVQNGIRLRLRLRRIFRRTVLRTVRWTVTRTTETGCFSTEFSEFVDTFC